MRRTACAISVVLAACTSGSPPDLLGLEDQVAAVAVELVIELDGTDPDGDALGYRVSADIALDATITQSPDGSGLFRWTPLAEHVGSHVFDFTVTDGAHDTTVSITVDVRAAIGAVPIFREPLGSGSVVDIRTTPCVNLAITVEDQDNAEVILGQEAPLLEGATLDQLDGTTGTWMWCPTPAQIATERHTLVLSADDGENPKTLKTYILVVRNGNTANPHLVINEVDYDQVNTDTREFIEIFNPASTAAALGGLQLVLVNGANSAPYDTIDLAAAGAIPPNGYLVIAGPNVTVAPTGSKLDPVWTQDQIQNGAPDGIALIDNVAHVVVDALSYEGEITSVVLPDFPAPVSLVEGTALPAAIADNNTGTASLCRAVNGKDTDDAAADWKVCTTISPGAAN